MDSFKRAFKNTRTEEIIFVPNSDIESYYYLGGLMYQDDNGDWNTFDSEMCDSNGNVFDFNPSIHKDEIASAAKKYGFEDEESDDIFDFVDSEEVEGFIFWNGNNNELVVLSDKNDNRYSAEWEEIENDFDFEKLDWEQNIRPGVDVTLYLDKNSDQKYLEICSAWQGEIPYNGFFEVGDYESAKDAYHKIDLIGT